MTDNQIMGALSVFASTLPACLVGVKHAYDARLINDYDLEPIGFAIVGLALAFIM